MRIVALLIIILCASCYSNDEHKYRPKRKAKVQEIHVDKTGICGETQIMPKTPAGCGGDQLIHNNYTEGYLNYLDEKGDKLVAMLGRAASKGNTAFIAIYSCADSKYLYCIDIFWLPEEFELLTMRYIADKQSLIVGKVASDDVAVIRWNGSEYVHEYSAGE